MALEALLNRWRTDPEINENIVEWRTIPARVAEYVQIPHSLHPKLVDALAKRGIHALYTHQGTAWEQARAGKNLVIVTGTSSGKTLCYNLPVLDLLLQDQSARALYLFPTKALAQDQISILRDYLPDEDYMPQPGYRPSKAEKAITHADHTIPFAVYDGDTPVSQRPTIRTNARLIISNPDMLHTGILPHHTSWADFFQNLHYVVIDEMHTYRGVFGSHVANVLRRLKRIALFYGSKPQFILTSATIANPDELAEWLIEEPVVPVNQDGSARGPKHFLIYNPPLVEKQLGIRRSVLQESVRLADDLLAYDQQTIIFARTRRSVELILTYLRERLPASPESAHQVRNLANQPLRGYRSGYLPHKRREIERGLRTGEVRAVVATTALELGIDIGGMNAAVLAGFPGTFASTWQQSGRAGRGNEASLAILLTAANPLDQFLARHTEYFFTRSPEQALVNPDNLLILLHHIRCAVFELPFQPGESFGKVEPDRLKDYLEYLIQEGILLQSSGKYFWMADRYPAEAVSLRSTSPDTVALQTIQDDEWLTVGQVDLSSAYWMVHPGAVYLHEAQTYLVEDLDLQNNVAKLVARDMDYFTEALQDTAVTLLEKVDSTPVQGGTITHGEIMVTTQVKGYRMIRWHTNETLGHGEVTLPQTELQTTGYWVALSDTTVGALEEMGLWTGSPNDYGPDWQKIRDRVRFRDEYRCRVCGAAEIGRDHDVHHIIPFRSFANRELANQLSNLVTVCPVCHRRAETAVRIRSGLAGLGFVLNHLSPLFLMCDVRDIGVHMDPQSPLSDGAPTIVIYDQVPAGIGFSERLYELHSEIMVKAWELVTGCPCTDGCPSCVGPGGVNGSGGKRETLAILEHLIKKN
jgi:DEAD/DEAH box helicase domain-containing protein